MCYYLCTFFYKSDPDDQSISRQGIEDKLLEAYRSCPYFTQTQQELGRLLFSVETENFVCLFNLMWPVHLRFDNKGQRKEEFCPIQNHHLQHKLPDTVQMGSKENFPQPHAQPSDLCRSGKHLTKFVLTFIWSHRGCFMYKMFDMIQKCEYRHLDKVSLAELVN